MNVRCGLIHAINLPMEFWERLAERLETRDGSSQDQGWEMSAGDFQV